MNTQNLVCEFGRHKGTLWTRVPVSYLKWLVNNKGTHSDIAAAELARRGTTTPELDISGHAIDRASQRCLKIWEETRVDDEGLHSWLARVAKTALDWPPDEKGRHHLLGMVFCFEKDGNWPVLKTVRRARQ